MPTDPAHRPTRTAGLLLRVRGQGGWHDEFYLAAGLTIGRSPANTIVVDDEAVDRAHARVEVGGDGTATLRCVGPDAVLAIPGGTTTRRLELEAGARFEIGPAAFECLSGRRGPGVPDFASDPTACPHCNAPCPEGGGDHPFLCPGCREPILPVRPDPHDRTPTLLPAEYGDFVADRFVARGGMSLVLRGACPGDRPVAIKVLLPDDDGESTHLGREAERLGRVSHPNVVGLLGHGRSGRFAYLALEWIEGPSLREVIAEADRSGRPIDFDDAGRWFEQVVRGLAAIHAVGMVHRDVKPSNILIGSDGVARVADLGIARRVDAGATMATTTGHAAGTFAYMAPEQFRARGVVDVRADLYALAVSFHELLTGSRPVGAWRPASEVRPDVPAEFTDLLGTMMAPRPEDRPRDIFEVLATHSTTSRPGLNATVKQRTSLDATSAIARVEVALRGAIGFGHRTWDHLAGLVGGLRTRHADAEDLANLMARNGAIRGGIWTTAIAAVISIPVALVTAIRDLDPTRLLAIVVNPLGGAFVGTVAGGLVGAIRGIIAGSSGRVTGTVVPLRVADELWRIAGPIRRWWSSAGRSGYRTGDDSAAHYGPEPPRPEDHVSPPGHEVATGRFGPDGQKAGSQPDSAESGSLSGKPPGLAAPTTRQAGETEHDREERAAQQPVRLTLEPLYGDPPWQLVLEDDSVRLIDLRSGATLFIDPARANEAITFSHGPGGDRPELVIRGAGSDAWYFRADPATTRDLFTFLEALPTVHVSDALRSRKASRFMEAVLGFTLTTSVIALIGWWLSPMTADRWPDSYFWLNLVRRIVFRRLRRP